MSTHIMKNKKNIIPKNFANPTTDTDKHEDIQSNSWSDLVDNFNSSEFLKWKRGLVIDFDKDWLFITSHLLRKLGAEVESTKNLTLAMDIVKKWNIDFIIISPFFYKDWSNKISEEDFNFLDNIKKEYNEIPVFAHTTASANIEQLKKLDTFSFVDIIGKPLIKQETLNLSLKKYLRPDLD